MYFNEVDCCQGASVWARVVGRNEIQGPTKIVPKGQKMQEASAWACAVGRNEKQDPGRKCVKLESGNRE